MPFQIDNDATLETNLIAYWKLDEASGTRFDSFGSNDLTDNNTVTQEDGLVIKSGQFTATNAEFLSHADNTDLSTGNIDFTVKCWVYLDSKAQDRYIAVKGDWSNSVGQEYRLFYQQTSDNFRFTVDAVGDGTGATGSVESTLTPSTGVWYFIVAWHDATNNIIGIQVNNGTADTVSYSGGVFDGTEPFVIGAKNGAGVSSFSGRIDEFGFWKKVLSTQEKTDLHNQGVGNTIVAVVPTFDLDTDGTLREALSAYWKLDEASGTRLDIWREAHLTDNNTVGQAVGKVNEAADFVSANNEFLSHLDAHCLSTGDIGFSIAGWVFVDVVGARRGFVAKGDWNAGSAQEYQLHYNPNNDRFEFGVSANGTAQTFVVANNLGSPSVATWYFIVGWHNATANTINIQVNNGSVDSAAYAGGVTNTAGTFVLGAYSDTPNFVHDGLLDEWGLWKKVLSTQEKDDLYNGGTGQTLSLDAFEEEINAETLVQTEEEDTIDADSDVVLELDEDITGDTTVLVTTATIDTVTLIKAPVSDTIDAVTLLKTTEVGLLGGNTTITISPEEQITAVTSILAREPSLVLYEQSDLSTPIGTSANPLDFGTVDAGTTEVHPDNPFVLFNDKDGTLNSFDAREITVSIVKFNLVDETLGTSDGMADQDFTIAFPPTVDSDDEITIKVNNVIWTRVQSFAGFQPTDEIYTFDATTGTATFGDGLQGKIPPIGNSIKASYTPDTQLFGKQAVEQLWFGIQSSGVISNNVDALLEERDAIDTTHVQIIHHPKVVSVTGVWLATDPNRLGTNYFTGGGFNDQTGIITLGTPLPSIQRVLVDYEYTIEDDAGGAFTQLSDTLTHTFANSIPSNNAKVLNFIVILPDDASSSGMATIKLKIKFTYKV